MSRKVLVFTGSRAEYGLLKPLMLGIQDHPGLELLTLVSGSHLSSDFGSTWQEVESDRISVDRKVEVLLASDSGVAMAKSVGIGVIGYADAISDMSPDVVVVLGDRFEALAFAQAAMLLGVPIAHLHGGELSEGAIDDCIRHSITKMSQFHFVAAEPYQQRVIQLGEQPETVFNFGALGVENFKSMQLPSRDEVSGDLGLGGRYVLVTYHAATLGSEDPVSAVRNLTSALQSTPDIHVLWTYPNADSGGRAIVNEIEKFAQDNPSRVTLRKSLGVRLYLGALKYASAVVGNSSSGLIEAPAVPVPTINIGTRQDGRLRAASVLDCDTSEESISKALAKVLSDEFRQSIGDVSNPYGDGSVSSRIIDVLVNVDLTTRKRFYDLG